VLDARQVLQDADNPRSAGADHPGYEPDNDRADNIELANRFNLG
jgi:hypothetical protein